MKDLITQTFGGCKNGLCNCKIKHPFEEHTASTFYVYDEGGGTLQQPVRVVSKENTFQLTVNNPTNKAIILGKLDKCLFDDTLSKCDCMLYDNEQLFFVEIKSSSVGSRGNKRRKAAGQLKQTIQYFRDSGSLFEGFKVIALICFKANEPRIIQPSRNSESAFFLLEMGVRLQEGNSIVFT